MKPTASFRNVACPLALLACRPDFGERESLLGEVRIVAVQAEPPEAKPGERVQFSMLVAGPNGPAASPKVDWALCRTPKPLTENGSVSTACLGEGVEPLDERTLELGARIPNDACALFGPEVTSADLRPRDPDLTGGYFQPVRVRLTEFRNAGTQAFAFVRLRCNLPDAPADVARLFGEQYVANRNPAILSVERWAEGTRVPFTTGTEGEVVALRVSWESPERFLAYDVRDRALRMRREDMRVSWYVTGGVLLHDRTGRTGEEPEAFSENAWTLPSSRATSHLFVVLRDDRGGVSFATYPVALKSR